MRDFTRHSRREPCPICGKPDWCRTFPDGYTECMRTESHRGPIKSGGWLHWTGPGDAPPDYDWRDRIFSPNPRPAPPATPPVDQAMWARGLAAILAACPLSPTHYMHLAGRGMSGEQIERDSYGTLPADRGQRHAIAAAVVEACGEAAFGQVPGLYRCGDGRPMIAGAAGILIPSRAPDGQLQGLRIRADNPTNGKYLWLSSVDRDGGCGSGAPAHVGMPAGSTEGATRAVFTEGELKANIIADRLGLPCVGVPGVNTIAAGVAAVAVLGVTEVAIAYDRDSATNPTVARAEADLIAALTAAGYRVLRLTWPEAYKGLDDALSAGTVPLAEPLTVDMSPCTKRVAELEQTITQLWAELVDLRKTHSAVVQAMKAPHLGPERTTATAIVLDLKATAQIGVWRPMPHARIADQGGSSVRAVPRHLEKLTPVFDGFVEFKKDKPPKAGDLEAVAGSPDHPWTYARLVADPLDALRAIATAVPAKGHKNGNGGRRIPCPDCGDAGIIRKHTDYCAGCGQALSSGETRLPPTTCQSVSWEDVVSDAETPAEATGQTDMSDAVAPVAEAVPSQNTPTDTVLRDDTLSSRHNDPTNRLAVARADLARRQAVAEAHSLLAAADEATDPSEFKCATDDLFTTLERSARARGRSPVPKPTAPPAHDRWDTLPPPGAQP